MLDVIDFLSVRIVYASIHSEHVEINTCPRTGDHVLKYIMYMHYTPTVDHKI